MSFLDPAYDVCENATVRYRVEVAHNESALDELENDWNRLNTATQEPNPFMTVGWYRSWLGGSNHQPLGNRLSPYVLVLKEGNSVAGIVPFVRHIASRLFRVRKLEFGSIHADYNDLVLGNDLEGQTTAVVDFLARTSEQWDVVDLRDLRDTGVQIAVIERALAHAGLSYHVLPEQNSCPYMKIDGDASEMTQRLSGHGRRALRNRCKRAAAQGLRTRIIENPAQEPDLLKKLIRLESNKHLRSIYPPFIGMFPDVFQSLIESLGPQGWLYVALLESGDQPVAFQLGFRCGDKLWDYSKAYDRLFSGFAPGTLLLLALLDYGFERGFREYDFLRGEEPYKLVWSTGSHRRLRVLIWNKHKISRVRKFIYFNLRSAFHRFLRRPA
ncbi:MAG TPA: GNAT family N-acetyltransferase [Terracidiphilus sp.]|jgi:CelD/BcsL family acetyltransferase involved in cellulose biosynthesis